LEGSDPDVLREVREPASWAVSLRTFLAVVVGYVVFSSGIVAFYALSGRDRHGHHPLSFLLFSATVGVIYSALAGYLCVAMIGRAALAPAIALAAAIALEAAVSLEFVPHGGSAWSQIHMLVLFAPAALAGGALRRWEAGRPRGRERG
jgi:NAD/NADP transhydrogenase beta subunit